MVREERVFVFVRCYQEVVEVHSNFQPLIVHDHSSEIGRRILNV
jgi:hypothetical protein